MMNARFLLPSVLAVCGLLASCQNDVSDIGSSLTDGEVTITVDSLETDINATTVYYDSFDGRNVTKLIGRLRVPEYGSLDCSFVSQMMSAAKMNIPDSITENDIDSIRLVLSVPSGSLTGDSLAPQQLRVYRLTKQLPADITTTFNPDGYYDASSLLGSRSYTLSNIAKGDSAMKKLSSVRIPVTLPRSLALDLFRKYRANDPVFEWPSTFNQYFPGIYVEQNFGNGCVANISTAQVYTYWHYKELRYEKQSDDTYKYVPYIMRDSVCLMASQPEVLSSNVISYRVSDRLKQLVADGKSIITTPGGYMVDIKFPVKRLIDVYQQHGDVMSVVSTLRMQIPASTVKNDYGLSVAPYLLMVKKSERDKFFKENKIPDGLTSFYAAYNSETGSYQFNSMRDYFLDVLGKVRKGEQLTDDDTDFCLIPVAVTLETVQGYNSSTVYVTKVQPYLTRPTMTQLATDRAIVSFIYTSQQID